MSIIWMDGFDGYATIADLQAVYTVGTSGASFITNGGRFGGGCFSCANFAADLIRLIEGHPAAVFTGIAIFPAASANLNSTNAIFTIVGEGGATADITYDYARGVFEAHVMSQEVFPVVIGQATSHFVLQAWHIVEISASISVTGSLETGYIQHATVELWVDNVLVLNSSGTCPTLNPSTFIVSVALGSGGSAGGNSSFHAFYDDWYISDGRIGDWRVETSEPVSDAGPNDGVPLVPGPHFAMVDAPQLSLSDFITLGDVTSNEELFNMAHLTSVPVSIVAVRSLVVASAENGSITLAGVIVSSSIEVDGTDTIITGTTPVHLSTIADVDPFTTTAWDIAGVNASQFGVKVTA